ncbi:hypothetical protein GDO81_021556 [Engystomops pustulosus]|uniref:Uncharacterized protein n=1 Tax=Engystomops pustulosus TaxID=76066 RepID=A0AAV6YVP6_ENGPU|nr:hypothetical protein GDO81_021556 [Engystomops pustulosus]
MMYLYVRVQEGVKVPLYCSRQQKGEFNNTPCTLTAYLYSSPCSPPEPTIAVNKDNGGHLLRSRIAFFQQVIRKFPICTDFT